MRKLLVALLIGTMAISSLTACSVNGRIKVEDKDGNGKITGASIDEQYSAILDLSSAGDDYKAWEVRYNPRNYRVGSNWQEAVSNNTGKYTNITDKLTTLENLDAYSKSDWLIFSAEVDPSAVSSDGGLCVTGVSESVLMNFGSTDYVSNGDIKEMFGDSKDTVFICMKGTVSDDVTTIDCLYPVIYDSGDGAYLYEPFFATMGLKVHDKNLDNSEEANGSTSSKEDTTKADNAENEKQSAQDTNANTDSKDSTASTAENSLDSSLSYDDALAMVNQLVDDINITDVSRPNEFSSTGYIYYTFKNNLGFPMWFDLKSCKIDGVEYDASEVSMYLSADTDEEVRDCQIGIPVSPYSGMVIELGGDIKDTEDFSTVVEGATIKLTITTKK